MPEIVLSTLNARYSHSSFGLRALLVNLEELRTSTVLREFTIQDSTIDMASDLASLNPKIIGFGIYIWNVEPTLRLIRDLRTLRPDLTIVLGGPEVSYETEQQEIVQLADYVITGEADLAFRDLCRNVLSGNRPGQKIHHAPVPDLKQVRMAYTEYTEEDIGNRVIYVEASRGCPFTCEFCLSALDIPVRQFPLEEFLHECQTLMNRGVRQFKFVDRTFNLNLRVSSAILQFFLDRMCPGLFLHFELIPDRLPDALKELIQKFPPGVLQFEIGVQTFNSHVCELISRPQDHDIVDANLRWLRQNTGVHLHTDLIVGLPGEDVASFGAGFDRLVASAPQEIQVGILKRLKGTPLNRHDAEWQMKYSDNSPYEILSTRTMSAAEIQTMRRFARFWDLYGNSGQFAEMTRLLLSGQSSPFLAFFRFCEWLHQTEGRRHGIALVRQFELLFHYLTECLMIDPVRCANAAWSDYTRGGRRDKPAFLQRFDLAAVMGARRDSTTPTRQKRHLDSREG